MAIEIWARDRVTGERHYLAWVAVNAFGFWLHQVEWLLEYLPLRNEGRWPPKPSDSGYVDNPELVQKSINLHAPFEAAGPVWAELSRRLAALGLSGERYAIEEHYGRGMNWKQIALDCHITEIDLDFRVKRAIKYIASGPCARFQECATCPRFLAYGRCKILERLKEQGRIRRAKTWADYIGHRIKGRVMHENLVH